MNRCKPLLHPPPRRRRPLLRALGVVLAFPLLSLPALAQGMVRSFPQQALRGTLTVTAPPAVLLDGRPEQLSPGARIRNPQNMLVMSGTLVGVPLVVNFTRESSGLIHEVWLLSPQEAALDRKLATPARNFTFSSEADAAPRDDGKTPFNLLPKFPQQ